MSICHLASLQAFVLSEQRPAPVFPSEFAQLRTLRYLGLGGNEWEDHFPSVIWQLRQLRALDLSWNYMTELPPEIGQLTELRFLYLQANHFRLLPEEMTQLLFLEDLKIWSHWLEPSSQASAQFQKLHEQIPALLRRFHFSDHYPCACCGYLTIEGPYDVCPVCYWEADDMQNVFPSSATGANRCCLIEARLNFARVGVSDDRLLDKARAPLPEEIPDEENRVPHMHFSKEGAEPTL
jgi:Leucine-rich repeat (LRR) protein